MGHGAASTTAYFTDIENRFAGVLNHKIMGNLFTLEGFLEFECGLSDLHAGGFGTGRKGLVQAAKDRYHGN
jgi:hypothetical protein